MSAVIIVAAVVSLHAQKSPWKFTECTSLNFPLKSINGAKARPGVGFSLGLSYNFTPRWQAYFTGRWNSFPSFGSKEDVRFNSYAVGAITLGARYERAISHRSSWFAGLAGLAAESEFYDRSGLQYHSAKRIPGLITEGGIVSVLVEGLDAGAFVSFTGYFPLEQNFTPAVNHAGAGIFLRWWWW